MTVLGLFISLQKEGIVTGSVKNAMDFNRGPAHHIKCQIS